MSTNHQNTLTDALERYDDARRLLGAAERNKADAIAGLESAALAAYRDGVESEDMPNGTRGFLEHAIHRAFPRL